eukprot:6178001-Pleurochrysis_carterae.AAC.1
MPGSPVSSCNRSTPPANYQRTVIAVGAPSRRNHRVHQEYSSLARCHVIKHLHLSLAAMCISGVPARLRRARGPSVRSGPRRPRG